MTEPQPTEEIWVFGGNRVGTHGQRLHAWLPVGSDEELLYKARGSYIPGSEYRVRIVRQPDGGIIKYGDSTYHQRHPDETRRARLEATHRAAETRLRLAALARNDKRQSALDAAMTPLRTIVAATSPADRDAVIAYILRQLLWTGRRTDHA
jgi:hypothetical protein